MHWIVRNKTPKNYNNQALKITVHHHYLATLYWITRNILKRLTYILITFPLLDIKH